MLTTRKTSDARIREEWLPDPEVWKFIHECLDKRFNIDAARLDERWIPLGIVGTLMWIEVAGWWIIENSGISATGEQFDTLHSYDATELDPTALIVLRHLREKAEKMLKNRWDNTALESDERGEILGFLKRCCFESSGVQSPPNEVLVSIVWGTMVWSLTDKGRDWVKRLDAMFECTVDHGVSYKTMENSDLESGELLDPSLVEDTGRNLGSCAKCNHKLWCVKDHCHKGDMVYLCYSCFQEEKAGGNIQYDWVSWDEHVNTMCKFDEAKENLDCASCRCPHAISNAEEHVERFALNKMKQRGSQRLLAFEEHAKRVGGVFGKRPEELVRYFKRE